MRGAGRIEKRYQVGATIKGGVKSVSLWVVETWRNTAPSFALRSLRQVRRGAALARDRVLRIFESKRQRRDRRILV